MAEKTVWMRANLKHCHRRLTGHAAVPYMFLLFWLAAPVSPLAQAAKGEEHSVKVRFVQSAYADYLFYLLYRNTGQFPQLETVVPLGKIPSLDQLISLPEQAASAQMQSYSELYPLVEQYRDATSPILIMSEGGKRRFRKLGYSEDMPPYQQLKEIIHQGEPSYPKFLDFWKTNIAPVEQEQIATWKYQLDGCDPLHKLQEVERLAFPFSQLDVASIALHLSGSGNTFPVGIYTTLFKKPNLAWVVGHEATHLMVDHYAGHNWQAYPLASRAIEIVKSHGGTDADIEESLSLFMQVKLSQICGYTEASRHISGKFPADSPKGAILRSLESGWDSYQTDSKQDIIDYLLGQTVASFPRPAK